MAFDLSVFATDGAAVPAVLFLTPADIAHAQFVRTCDLPPNMARYETAESVFLDTPADTADAIIRKLELAEYYLDEVGGHSPGDLDAVRLVMALVRKGELESAVRYGRAILDGYADEFCLTPIRAAIADMEALV